MTQSSNAVPQDRLETLLARETVLRNRRWIEHVFNPVTTAKSQDEAIEEHLNIVCELAPPPQ